MTTVQIIGNPDTDYILLLPAYNKYKYIDFRIGEGVEDVICDRNSLGTAIQTRGNDSFSYSKPRITDFGLLVEESRSNLFIDNDFSTWISGSTTVNESIVSPSRYLDATMVTENTASSIHGLLKSVSVTSGTSYTFSVFAKKGTRDVVQLHVPATGGGATCYANFDLTNGVKGTVGGGCTATMDNVGYGWYRLSITFTAAATTTASFSYLHVTATTSAANLTHVGTSLTSYVWGASLEAGAFRTGFIAPNTTRGTELVTLAPSITLPAAFTLYVEATFNQTLAQTQTLLDLNDTTTSNNIVVTRTSSGVITVIVKNAGATVVTKTFNSYTGALNVKVGISFTGTAWIIGVNSDTTTATASLPAGMVNVALGSGYDRANPVNCFIQKFAILGTAFDVDSLKILTNNEIPVELVFYLLKEDGGFLLAEDGGKIILD